MPVPGHQPGRAATTAGTARTVRPAGDAGPHPPQPRQPGPHLSLPRLLPGLRGRAQCPRCPLQPRVPSLGHPQLLGEAGGGHRVACPGGPGSRVSLTFLGFFSVNLLSLPAWVRGWLPSAVPADSEPGLPPGPHPAAQAPWGAGGRLGPRQGRHPEQAPLPGEAGESSGRGGGHVGGLEGPHRWGRGARGAGPGRSRPPQQEAGLLVGELREDAPGKERSLSQLPLQGHVGGGDQRGCPVTWKV